ncbi:hypothetical protein [Actinacidiphila oryziradicis]|uniref:Uncharacterized protein n=1 Tax=Actinacidiphila oryziradicis TaxID=2571141 RepID=A0A4U0RQI9_9ACTN|nr:hypothetical protein [Actinacidiphila oryziradicis]TJZ98245.1 hypothetical protein FCI23_48675 [Actinacidiphila oryziradicis]
MLDHHTHRQAATILNERGLTSGKGQPFTELLVGDIRDSYGLVHRYDRLRGRGLLTFAEYADAIGVSENTVKIWRRTGLIEGIAYNDKNCYLFHPPAPTTRLPRSPGASRSATASRPARQLYPHNRKGAQCDDNGLSKHDPTRPIDCTTPSRSHRSL